MVGRITAEAAGFIVVHGLIWYRLVVRLFVIFLLEAE